MASYKIQWKKSASRELKQLDRTIIPKVIQAVEKLTSNPVPRGSRKLKGSEHTYRMRLGEYRIIYTVKSKVLVIEVIRVGHRKEIYRRLT